MASDDSNNGRDETEAERADRNWNELLQELRVTQTGVQLLTGLLLTLPFQQRFTILDDLAKGIYLAVVISAVSATALLIAPVAFHRLLFRQGEKDWLASRGNWSAMCGLAALAFATSGALWLILDVVAGRTPAFSVGGGALVVFAGLWWVFPLNRRRKV